MERSSLWLLLVLTLTASVIGGAVSGWLLMGRPVSTWRLLHPPKAIDAETVRLVDQDGRVRARLVLGSHGVPGLGLWDQDGQVRITLGLGADGEPSLNLLDKEGRLRASFKLGRGGTPELTLSDMDGQSVWSAP